MGVDWEVVQLSVGIFLTVSIFLGVSFMMLCIVCFKPDYDFQNKQKNQKKLTIHTRNPSVQTTILDHVDSHDL